MATMTDYNPGVKTAELLVTPPRSDHGLRSMLYTLPRGKGWVFGLVDVDLKDEPGRERIAHIMASHLEHLSDDLAGDANPPRRFEQMLGELNADLLNAAQEVGLRHDRFHGVVGLVSKNQIFISGIGKLSALFLHKTADRRYSVYELDAQFHEGRMPEEQRFFLTILDGEVHAGDVFYVATPLPHHALSPNELHDILVTLPPTGSLQRIRQFVPPSQHYGAVGFSFTEELKAGGPPKKTNPIGSLEELQTSQERTATVLGESNAELTNLVKNLAHNAGKYLSAPGTRNATSTLKRGLTLLLQGAAKVASVLLVIFQKIFNALGVLLSNILLTSSKKGGASFKMSPKKTLALLSVLALIVMGSGLIFLTKGNKEREAQETSFAETVDKIEEKILAAEASLIYRNTEEARTTVVEAATILETLPKDTSEHKTEAEELAAKLAVLQDKIRGITTVNPQLLASLPSDDSMSVFTTATLVSGRLYGFSNKLGVYRLDGLSNTWVKEESTVGILGYLKSATAEGNNVIVLDDTKQLGRADFTAKTLNPVTSGTNGMLSVEDVTSYGGNLYALSAASGQVVKMRPLGPSYEAGTVWITQKESDLSTARAIAIDGDVYILTAGDILRFRSGKEQSWAHETLDPALVNPVDIWTDLASKYLYILDPGSSRIIVMNKESGAIEKQYTNGEIKNALAFTVEESANRILFVTAEKAYAFTADHLLK